MKRKIIKLLLVGLLSISFGNIQVSANSTIEKLTYEYAKQIAEGKIMLESNRYDNLLYGRSVLVPNQDADGDGLKNDQELYIYTKNNRKYVGYYSHPRLYDTDGDGYSDKEEYYYNYNPREWNVTARDLAMFMELSYRDDSYIRKVVNEFHTLNEVYDNRHEYVMMHRELAPFWRVKEVYHEQNGFDAILFEFRSEYSFLRNGSIQVLAIRGTSEANDFDDDAAIAASSSPDQARTVRNLINSYANRSDITNLYITGHSLGGYLSQVANVEANNSGYSWIRKAYTFNAPQITALIYDKNLLQVANMSDYLTRNKKAIHYATTNDTLIRLIGNFDGAIRVGESNAGHGSRSYFELFMDYRNDFKVGRRNTMSKDGIYSDAQRYGLQIRKVN